MVVLSSPPDTPDTLKRPADITLPPSADQEPEKPQPKPKKVKKRKLKPSDGAKYTRNPFIMMEADLSGPDDPGASSDSDQMESEDEYDREFMTQGPATQAHPSYDQTAAYRQSLFTQAPPGYKGPQFMKKPLRTGHTGLQTPALQAPRRPIVLSSPARGAGTSEPDEYALGSFVVEDDDEILGHDLSSDV
jgi:ATP-dependent DNA helicase MPH1